MLNKIISIFRTTPTVASVTAGFQAQIDQLDAIAEAKLNEVMEIDDQISALEAKGDAAVEECIHADNVAARIKFLLLG